MNCKQYHIIREQNLVIRKVFITYGKLALPKINVDILMGRNRIESFVPRRGYTSPKSKAKYNAFTKGTDVRFRTNVSAMVV